MHTPEDHNRRLPAYEVLKNLSDIRDSLVKINAKNSGAAGYFAMRKEIEAIGWSGILQKYHPDINMNNPAAMALFELYRFVYKTMKK
jgi:hypothetical protein